MAMRNEKPDTTRQSEGFDQVHTGLTVGQIAVPRRDLRTCTATNRESEVRALNQDPVFDYLPVEDTDGHVIGLLANHAIRTASRDGGDARVVDRMDPLSEADLIGTGAPIVALIGQIRQKPFLVVSGQEIIGMVAWSDLQKLPVRAALFSLVTGFELTMYEAIRRHFEGRDDWTEHVDECRLCMAKKEYRSQQDRGSEVDLLLCTQFCDKRDILIGSFDFAIGKKKLKKKFRAIERIRNDVAHANNYAMAFEQAEKLRSTLGDPFRASKPDQLICPVIRLWESVIRGRRCGTRPQTSSTTCYAMEFAGPKPDRRASALPPCFVLEKFQEMLPPVPWAWGSKGFLGSGGSSHDTLSSPSGVSYRHSGSSPP